MPEKTNTKMKTTGGEIVSKDFSSPDLGGNEDYQLPQLNRKVIVMSNDIKEILDYRKESEKIREKYNILPSKTGNYIK